MECTVGAVLAGLLLPVAVAAEQALSIGPDLAALGWQELKFDGKTPNRFEGTADGVLSVRGDGSVSMLYRAVSPEAPRGARLAWRWRVDGGVPPTDLSRKGGDDRSLAVYVGFAYDPEHASFMEQLKRPLVTASAGADAPGRVIAYVWGGARPAGTVVPSPHMGDAGQFVILRQSGAPTGAWLEEAVDPGADYRRIFGDPPPAVVRIAISADGDDTGSSLDARIADIRFVEE